MIKTNPVISDDRLEISVMSNVTAMFVDSGMQLSASLSNVGRIAIHAVQFVYDIQRIRDGKRIFMNPDEVFHFIDTVIRESNIQIFNDMFKMLEN